MIKLTSLEPELAVRSVDHTFPLSFILLSGTGLVNTYWEFELSMKSTYRAITI